MADVPVDSLQIRLEDFSHRELPVLSGIYEPGDLVNEEAKAIGFEVEFRQRMKILGVSPGQERESPANPRQRQAVMAPKGTKDMDFHEIQK